MWASELRKYIRCSPDSTEHNLGPGLPNQISVCVCVCQQDTHMICTITRSSEPYEPVAFQSPADSLVPFCVMLIIHQWLSVLTDWWPEISTCQLGLYLFDSGMPEALFEVVNECNQEDSCPKVVESSEVRIFCSAGCWQTRKSSLSLGDFFPNVFWLLDIWKNDPVDTFCHPCDGHCLQDKFHGITYQSRSKE